MTHNDIKKELYRRSPQADFMSAQGGQLHYSLLLDEKTIWFAIPFTDIGDAKFYMTMPAKLLIRWLVVYGTEEAQP